MALCPHCGIELTHRPVIASDASTTRVGVEYPDLYDGILFWRCPQCDWAWPREFRHQRYLALASREQADRHNAWNASGKEVDGVPIPVQHTIVCPLCGMSTLDPDTDACINPFCEGQ